jgi:outer membrane assembly lipoprotein YfiO
VTVRRVAWVMAVLALLFAAGGCASAPTKQKAKKPGKTASLPPEQVYEMALQRMAKKRYFGARTLLQEVLPRIPPEDRDLLPRVQLALADAFFKDGGQPNFAEALNAYRNFLTYFPQHEKAAYAQYMVGLSMFRQVLAPDRDQTMTYKAIDELHKVETRFPDSPYVDDARRTLEQCYDRLAEKERLVGRFYQRRKSWPAAIDSYRTVIDKYPKFSNISRVLLDMGRCLLAVNQRDQAQEMFDHLAREDHTGKLTRQAKQMMKEYERRREKEGEKFYGELSKPHDKGSSP